MEGVSRYAVYWMPEGALAEKGAEWLGWDAWRGRALAPPDLPGLPRPAADLTVRPRKYGLHATLKPPMVLAQGHSADALTGAVAALAARTAPAEAEALEVAGLGRFVALRPVGETAGIARVAAACVSELDAFRAPPAEADLARRRAAGLTPAQEAHLARWGYPYVFEEFRFHVTLTGPLDEAEVAPVARVLGAHFGGLVPRPFRLDTLALCGEGADGRFRVLGHWPLTG